MKLRWTIPAVQDLKELHAYIADRNPAAVIRMAHLLRSHAEGLSAHPHKGRPGRIDGTRELVISGTSFVIAYRLADDFIDILAIRHGARNWQVEG